MDEFELADVVGPHEGLHVCSRSDTVHPKSALLLFHGRGSNGGNILRAAEHISLPDNAIAIAPTAMGNSWYPGRFIAPREDNEPYLSSALSVVEASIRYCKEEFDIDPSTVTIAGFSQGACLIADFAARHPQKFKGLCIWSGGVIGSDDEVHALKPSTGFAGTQIYVGCNDTDPHIPAERVRDTSRILKEAGADVTLELYPGVGHAIHTSGYTFLDHLMRK